MRSVCSQLTSSSLSCGRFLNGLCGMSNVLSNSGGEETVISDAGSLLTTAATSGASLGPGFSIGLGEKTIWEVLFGSPEVSDRASTRARESERPPYDAVKMSSREYTTGPGTYRTRTCARTRIAHGARCAVASPANELDSVCHRPLLLASPLVDRAILRTLPDRNEPHDINAMAGPCTSSTTEQSVQKNGLPEEVRSSGFESGFPQARLRCRLSPPEARNRGNLGAT